MGAVLHSGKGCGESTNARERQDQPPAARMKAPDCYEPLLGHALNGKGRALTLYVPRWKRDSPGAMC